MEMETVKDKPPALAPDFGELATRFGLKRDSLKVEPILNWGGFVNQSFHLCDGEQHLHLKVTQEFDNVEGLRRWYALREHLHQHYRAPRVLGWIEQPAGLVFESVEGRQPDLASSSLFGEVCQLLRQLHQDPVLKRALAGTSKTCAKDFEDVFIDRFLADLEIVRGARPPFLSLARLDWMERQVSRLCQRVRTTPAFELPAEASIHGDPWEGNLLETEAGWCLLDWDDLHLGDPAQDLAIFRSRRWIRSGQADCWLEGEFSGALGERMKVYEQACLLDGVLDVLADWVEAEKIPAHREALRKKKREEHEHCLALYEVMFAGP